MAGHIATSSSVEWNTPQEILAPIKGCFRRIKEEECWDSEFEIDLDPCSNKNSIVGAKVSYCLPENDGLVDSWNFAKTIFVNPPWGRCCMHRKTKEILSHQEFLDAQSSPDFDPSCYTNSCITDWIKRCNEASINAEVIALIPAAVDTRHWQNIVFKTATGICFIRGRVKFVGAKSSCPTPCALVYWGSHPWIFQDYIAQLGTVLFLSPDVTI